MTKIAYTILKKKNLFLSATGRGGGEAPLEYQRKTRYFSFYCFSFFFKQFKARTVLGKALVANQP